MLDDLREQRLEPLDQRFAAGVAEAQPDDAGSLEALAEPMRKILVLGDDDGLVEKGIGPNRRVLGIAQAEIGDVFGLVAVRNEQPGQCRRQLGANQEAH